jgi:HEAT repeat protein
VRANAIRSLLRLDIREAAGALLDMLEDDSSSHRISALWLIERLNLRSVLRRVELIQAGDPDERVRQRARRIMQEAGKSRARPDASHVNIHPARTPGADQP